MKIMKINNEEGIHLWESEPIIKHGTIFEYIKSCFNLYHHILFKEFRAFKKNQTILDFGCGTGGYTIDLSKYTSAKIIGIDISQTQIDKAKINNEKWGGGSCFFQKYDGKKIPYPDNFFDGIISIDVFGHLPNLQAALYELSRVLKPGGRFAVFSESRLTKGAFLQYWLFKRGIDIDSSSKHHISLFSRKELIKMLNNAGLTVRKTYCPYRLRLLTHPEWFYPEVKKSNLSFLKIIISLMFWVKRITDPIYSIISSLLSIVEIHLFGKNRETMGLFIYGEKNNPKAR